MIPVKTSHIRCVSIVFIATIVVDVQPLVQHDLRQKKMYWRELDKLASTEFTFTRFLVPHLMNYKGWALFIDCDIIFWRM